MICSAESSANRKVGSTGLIVIMQALHNMMQSISDEGSSKLFARRLFWMYDKKRMRSSATGINFWNLLTRRDPGMVRGVALAAETG